MRERFAVVTGVEVEASGSIKAVRMASMRNSVSSPGILAKMILKIHKMLKWQSGSGCTLHIDILTKRIFRIAFQ